MCVKAENNQMLNEKRAMSKRWVEYSEDLLNVDDDRPDEIVAV